MPLSLVTNSDTFTTDSMVANADLYIHEELIPAVFDGVTVLQMMGGKSMLDMTTEGIESAADALDLRNGGEVIAINLMTNKGAMTQALDEFEIITTTPPRVAETSWIPWCEYATPATVSRRELRKNSGAQSHFKIQDARLRQAQMDLIEQVEIDLIRGDQSEATLASLDANKRMVGISYYIEEDPDSAASTVAHVARAANTWHQNHSNLTASNSISDTPSFASEGLVDLLQLGFESDGGSGVDEIDAYITNDTIVTYWWNELDDLVRLQPGGSGDIYVPPSFRGKPVYRSKALSGISVANVYGLCKKYWKFVVDRESFFAFSGTMKPYNQLAETEYIILMANLICENPRRQFVLTGITA